MATPARTGNANGAREPKQARSKATRQRLLDAAVDELVAAGYANLTTSSVAERAGVSRGAQQHHFPQKATLVAEAVSHLARRQIEQIQQTAARASVRGRAETILDLLYDLYSGPLFVAMLELTLAARNEPELAQLVTPIDREVGRDLLTHGPALFGPEAAAHPDFDLRLRHILATIRGLALPRIHDRRRRASQWRFTRAELVALLGRP